MAGRTDKAAATYRETLLIDPFSARAYQGLYVTFINGGRYADAKALLEEGRQRNPAFPVEVLMAPIYAYRREFARLDAVVAQARQIFPPQLGIQYAAIARRGLGDQAAGDEAIVEILDVPPPFTPSNYVIAEYFAAFSDFDDAIRYLDGAAAIREIGLAEALTSPLFSELRKEPRFWAWVERAGIKPLE